MDTLGHARCLGHAFLIPTPAPHILVHDQLVPSIDTSRWWLMYIHAYIGHVRKFISLYLCMQTRISIATLAHILVARYGCGLFYFIVPIVWSFKVLAMG
jgi:hypothetical protein